MDGETLPEFEEEPQHDETDALRRKLLALSDLGQIKYKASYLKKASEKTLRNIERDYKRQHLQKLNEQMSELLIYKGSDMLGALKLVEDSEHVKEELMNDKLFKDDLRGVVGGITPHVKHVGLLSGCMTVG